MLFFFVCVLRAILDTLVQAEKIISKQELKKRVNMYVVHLERKSFHQIFAFLFVYVSAFEAACKSPSNFMNVLSFSFFFVIYKSIFIIAMI